MFIEDYFGIKLKDVQKVQARAFGNCDDLVFVQSRGFGKTWITALCCLAIGVLYPNSPVSVVSGTFDQATLVLKKIQSEFSQNPNILREIAGTGNGIVRMNKGELRCVLKNGSVIAARTIGTMRGQRAKVIVIDEAPEVSKEDINAVVNPVKNYSRMEMTQLGLADYPSKSISITSACLKSNYFFEQFSHALHEMANGEDNVFACALDYKAAERAGITSHEFFEKERKRMPETMFAMEYGSIFVGAEQGSIFPYELTERCRTLNSVEVAMPAKSTSDYVISIDLATSSASHADNAVITVIKLIERDDGGYMKNVVCIRSFHGKRLDYLAAETRKLLVKFPRTIKVVFDHRGLGDAFPRFFAQPWIDPETNREYPPLVLDTELSAIHDAIPMLHPVVANSAINQQLVSSLAVAFERGTIALPIQSRKIINDHVVMDDEDDGVDRKYLPNEKAIFIEADALQIEMGNIVGRVGSSGSILYDVAKSSQHKDRYSSLAMGIWYIRAIEDERISRMQRSAADACVGIVLNF